MQGFSQNTQEILKQKEAIFYTDSMFRREKNTTSKVDFATAVWEEDYELVLEKGFLEKKIAYHKYPFSEIILLINNVSNKKAVLETALSLKIFTTIYLLEEFAKEIFLFFAINPSTLTLGSQQKKYPHLTNQWVYYNALAPLGAIYFTKAPYLLYCTGDVYLDKPVSWIEKGIQILEKKQAHVANLLWNHRFFEAKQESFKQTGNFFLAEKGFSDQLFLIPTKEFQRPIYSCLCEADQFPRGEVFEKRVFCHMQKSKWKRATYKKGSYIHA